MIKKLALVLVVISLVAAPIVLAGNGTTNRTHQVLQGAGEINGDTISAYAYEYSTGSSYVRVNGYFNGDYFYCYAYGILGLLDVNPSAKSGILEVDTSALNCYYDPPPPTISVECVSNGEYSHQSTGNYQTKLGDGTFFKGHEVRKSEQADCTFTADSVVYNPSEMFIGGLTFTRSHD
jgi:hypothetical protein